MNTATADATQEVYSPVLYDDGQYYIERNTTGLGGRKWNGFLLHRCKTSLTSPDGYECIGGYDKTVTGKWLAWIDLPLDHREEKLNVGEFDVFLDAIDALWKRRHEARCDHEPRHE